MKSFEEFKDAVLGFGAIQYDGLEDGDDPLAHALLFNPEGALTMVAITLDMLAPANKPGLVHGVCENIEKDRIVRVGWLLPTWQIIPEPGDDRPPAPNFADDDRAVEVFMAMLVERDQAIGFQARVNRNPSGLGDWEEKGEVKGLFVQPIQRALKGERR